MRKAGKINLLKMFILMSVLLCSLVVFDKETYAVVKEGKNIGMITAWLSKWRTISGYQFKSTATSLYYRKDSKSKTRKIAYDYGYIHGGKLFYTTPKVFYMINLKTNKKTKLLSNKYQLIIQGITGDKVYLEKHTSTKSLSVLVYSISKRKVVSTIKTSSIGNGRVNNILGEVGNRLYYDTSTLYNATVNGITNQKICRYLYVYNPSTKKRKLISKDFHGATVIGNHVYYDVKTKEDGEKNWFSVYRCDLKGGHPEKLRDFVVDKVFTYELTFTGSDMLFKTTSNRIEIEGYGTYGSGQMDDECILKYNFETNVFKKINDAV
ncbi:MAG: hypothetical protein Q4E53_14540 [Eubacteriales bacterium]|nr:hypothetical protein [Eubacteriales bacterium]